MQATRADRPQSANHVVLSGTAIAGIAAIFLLMGLVVASYGPLLEHLTRRFGVSLPIAGATISVHFAGGLIGVLIAMRILPRVPGRLPVMVALAVESAGCIGVAVAPAWILFVASIFVVGLGFGVLVIALNQLVAYSEGGRRAALLSALNSAYSGGAVVGPLLVAQFADTHFALLFLAAAVVGLALVPAASGIAGQLPTAAPSGGAAGSNRATGVLIAIFVAAFILYVGVENGAGGWMTSHLEAVGLTSRNAAIVTSGFWLSLAFGRLLITLVPASVGEPAIVIGGASVAAVALLAASIGALAPFAYIVAGLAIAPIFPTGVVWLARLRPGDSSATSLLFPAASIGGIVGPGAIGLVIARSGVAWAPPVLGAVAIAMTVAFGLAALRSRR